MNKERVKSVIQENLDRAVSGSDKLHNAYLLVHSDRMGLHWNLASGTTNGLPARPEQPYHSASVGKTFTACILMMLKEKGLVDLDQPVAGYLPEELVQGLHIYKGRDYSYQITTRHLLGHTSGLPHFAEEKLGDGRRFLDLAIESPNRFWTAEETIEWSIQNLKPHFPPGKGCFYSETGFNLLGLIIESVTGKPYYEVLHEYIFWPLGMKNSCLSQYSRPEEESDFPEARVYQGEMEIDFAQYRSFSAFYASGQTVNTSEDLLKFMKALVQCTLISEESLAEMKQWRRLMTGVDYGYGLMRVRMVPFLQKYYGFGHLGSITSFMLYFPAMEVYLTGSFNQTVYMAQGMRFLFKTLRLLPKSPL